MESNGWLVLVTAGLSLDIAGIIILSKPLLSFNRKTTGDLLAELIKTRDYLNYITGVLIDYELKPHSVHMSKKTNTDKLEQLLDVQIFHTTKNNFNLILSKIKQEQVHFDIRNNATIALIIISIGFFLQIIGNAMK